MKVMTQFKRIRYNMSFGQIFFMLLMIPLGALGPVMYQVCNTFVKYRALERPDYEVGRWCDFELCLYIVPLISLCKYVVKVCTRDYFYSRLKNMYWGETLDLKMAKCAKSVFKIFYFTFITAFGFYVFSDTAYQSPLMFGSGDFRLMGSDWPYNIPPRGLKVYYMIGLSYHIEDIIHHLVAPAQNDFFEMLLHHYITILLVGGSYLTSIWNSGINVMVQMDNGDIFVGVLRAFLSIAPTSLIFTAYLGLLASWLYFRVFVFSYEIVWGGGFIGRWRCDHIQNQQICFQILNVVLLMLNIYWSILFFRMGYRLLTKGEVKDIQNPAESIDAKISKNKVK